MEKEKEKEKEKLMPSWSIICIFFIPMVYNLFGFTYHIIKIISIATNQLYEPLNH